MPILLVDSSTLIYSAKSGRLDPILNSGYEIRTTSTVEGEIFREISKFSAEERAPNLRNLMF